MAVHDLEYLGADRQRSSEMPRDESRAPWTSTAPDQTGEYEKPVPCGKDEAEGPILGDPDSTTEEKPLSTGSKESKI